MKISQMLAKTGIFSNLGLRNVAKNARKPYGILGTRRVANIHHLGNPAGHFMSVSEGARLIVLPMDDSGWHGRQGVQKWDRIDRLLAKKDLDHATSVQSLGICTQFVQ